MLPTPPRRLVLAGLAKSDFCPERLRRPLLIAAGMQLGEDTYVFSGLRLRGDGVVSVGRSSFINHDVFLDTMGGITIGDKVAIADRAPIITSGHQFGPTAKRAGPRVTAPVVTGCGAWLGSGCCILPGVTAGAGAIVGAGALVTRDVPPDTLVVGVPAQVQREL